MQTPVKSPCIGTCTLDAWDRYCIGCLRTVEEISDWRRLTEEQQARIVEDLEQRAINVRRVYE